MKKSIPLLILMGMVLLLFISWSNVINYNSDIDREYEKHIKAAEAYLEKDIKIDAVKEYERALKVKPGDYKLAMKIADLYWDLQDTQKYITSLEVAIKADKNKEKPYVELAKYYMDNGNFRSAYEVLDRADKLMDSSRVTKMLVTLKGKFTVIDPKIENATRPYYFKGDTIGYRIAENEKGKKSLITSAGKSIVEYDLGYDDVGLLSEDVIPVKKDGEYFYITQKGYRKLVPDEKAEYLGVFVGKYAPACFDGKWGYVDKNMKQLHMDYSHTYPFANNIAAVQDGDDWYVLNAKLKKVGKTTFEDILLDEYGFCSTWGVFWAKADGKYNLYNTAGKKLTKEGYDEVKLFVSDEAAAVRKGKKWGFVSTDGKEITKFKYDNADSYNVGYAPVLIDGKWGAIDRKENVVIDPQFKEFTALNKDGTEDVVDDEGKKLLTVKLYK